MSRPHCALCHNVCRISTLARVFLETPSHFQIFDETQLVCRDCAKCSVCRENAVQYPTSETRVIWKCLRCPSVCCGNLRISCWRFWWHDLCWECSKRDMSYHLQEAIKKEITILVGRDPAHLCVLYLR